MQLTIKKQKELNMDKLDRKSIRNISAAMEEAVQSVADKFGVNITANGARFSSAEATFKFNVEPATPGAGVFTKEEKAYDLEQKMRKLPARDAVIEAPDKTRFRVVGWRSRARKYPIVAIDLADNSKYTLTVDYVNNCKRV